jgi:hypothetical protein
MTPNAAHDGAAGTTGPRLRRASGLPSGTTSAGGSP